MHTTPIQLRFNDIDQMGHVNNAVIMEFLDLAKSRYFHDAGVPVTPDEGDFCVMIVHIDSDFHRQIHFHDDVAVTTYTSHLGNKSIEITQQVIVGGALAVSSRTVLSGYSRSAAASAPLPQSVRDSVTRYDASH